MVNAVKQGYVNPLTMMKQGKQTNHFPAEAVKNVQKRQKNLETEKQSIQNTLLLMKGTSGESGASKENIELLEKKLEEVTAQVEAGRQQIAFESQATEKSEQESSLDMITRRKHEKNATAIFQKNNFDRFSKTTPEEPNGRYRILKDGEEDKIEQGLY